MPEFNAKLARAKRPIPIWCDALQRDTQHLEADEFGAYLSILMAMWGREKCDFPDDDRKLARVSRVSRRLWTARIWPSLSEFFTIENGAITQKRLQKEAAYTERQVTHQSNRKTGKKHGKPLKTNNVTKSGDISVDTSGDNPTQLPNYPTERIEANASLSSGDDLPKPVDEISLAVNEYNEAAKASGWPCIRILSKARRSALAARLNECDGIDGWRVALEKAQASNHCCGNNERGWTANFDFLSRQSSFAKLMEGNYDNRSNNTPNTDATLDAISIAGRMRRTSEASFS